MNALASAIRDRWDTLLDEYDRRLQAYSAYAAMPAVIRHEAARRTLNLVADWLESDDDTQLIQFIQATTKERTEQGLDIGIMQYAVNALEAILDPLIEDVQTARLVWRTLFKTQEAITHQVFELHRQGVTGRKQAEQALTESQQLLQLVMNNIPQALFWKDQNLTYLGCNRAFAADAGLASPSDAIGKTDWDMPWKEQAELYRADDSRVMENGISKLDYEEPQTTPDGSTIWLRTSKVPLRDATGNVTAVLGMYEDITERKRAEASLQESKHLLQLVMDNIPQSIFWKDTGLVYRGCNRQFVKEGSFSSPDQIVGKTAYDMPWADNAEFYYADDRQVIETDTPKLNIEEPLRKGDGTLGWLRTNKIPMHDARGQVIGILSTSEDITEQKRAEAALRESRQLLQTVMDNIPQSIFWKDRHLVYLGCNRAFAADAALASPSDAIGKTDWDMPWKEQAELYRADDSRVMESGAPKLDYEEPQTTPDGSTIWLRTSKVPLRDSAGNVTAVLGMYEDITERKRLERQIQESLEQRSHQVQVSTQVAQEIAAAPALDELFRRVVTLVKERFGYYHAQILRYDPAQNAVVLVSGYGQVGQNMLAAKHSVAMGRGVVGTAADTGQSVLATDVAQDNDWRPNPNLPTTRGELAVPIKLRDQVLGILDVQSDRANALTAEDQLLLEGLCGQIAVAIEGTRLLTQVQQSEQLMRSIIDATPDWIFIKDQDHCYRLVNQGYANDLHIRPSDFIGKNDLQLGFPEELVKGNPEKGIRGFWADDRLVMDTGETQIYPNDPTTIDGVVHTFHTIKTPLRDPQGHVWGVLAFARDVTDREQAQAQMRETLQEVERLYRATTREGWQTFLKTGRLASGYRYDRVSVQPDENVWAQPIEQAIQQNTLITSSGENAVAAAPLSVRGAIIGALGVYDDPKQPLSSDELALLQEIIEQGALALENARLYQDTQRRAAREQAINEITARIRSTATLEGVLNSAVREISALTGASFAEIELQMAETDS